MARGSSFCFKFLLFPFTQVLAPSAYSAGRTFGISGGAGVSAVEDEPVVGLCAVLQGDVLLQVLPDGCRRLSGRKPESVRNPEDMGVDGYDRLLVYDGGYDVRGLEADSGKSLKLIDVGRYLPSEIRNELFRHFDEMAGLAVGVGDAADQGVEFLECGL